MSELLVRWLPNGIKLRIRTIRYRVFLAWELLGDFQKLSKYSLAFEEKSAAQFQASLAAASHGIEKGLSLKGTRTWFGLGKVSGLINLTHQYAAQFGVDQHVARSIGTLDAYLRFHQERDLNDASLQNRIAELKQKFIGHGDCISDTYGTIQKTSDEIYQATSIDWYAFLKTRHSIRQFSEVPVERSLIEKAVSQAQLTPSVCNRQSSRVIAVRENMQEVLQVQGGSKGFGEQASWVLIVLSEIGAFFPGERNQCWIDGGMFAMTLVYSLHALGLGTCCLEWTSLRKKEQVLRKLVPIKDSECVIMLIAVGSLPEEFCVASSPRLSSMDVLRVIDAG